MYEKAINNKISDFLLVIRDYFRKNRAKGDEIISKPSFGLLTVATIKSLLKLVDRETYVIHTKEPIDTNAFKVYVPKVIDDETFEVDLHKDENLHDFIDKLSKINVTVTDIRPKGNRIEKLYLNILGEQL